MKKLVLCVSLLFVTSLFAQTPITLTSADAPMVGQRIVNINNMTGLFNAVPGIPGANQIFDFSMFPNDNADSTNYIAPSSTPYAADFTSSNLASLTLPDTNYMFYTSNASQIEVNGMIMAIPFLGLNISATSTNGVKQINFPANYGDNFNDVGEFGTNTIPLNLGLPSGTLPGVDSAWIDSMRATTSITRTSVIDAWGTTITPQGSFNTLRQKAIDVTTISPEIYVVTLVTVFGSQIEIPLGWIAPPVAVPGLATKDSTTTYYYYTNAISSNPSLVAEIQVDSLGIVVSANYSMVYNPAGIIETNNNIISEMYPNPSTDFVNIKAIDKIETLNVYTEDGKLIFNRNINSDAYSLTISTFKTGVYFVEINTSKGREVKRINKI